MLRLLFIIIFIPHIILCQETSNETSKRYILIGGTAHIGNGEVVENSTIIIEDTTAILNLLF